MKICRITSVFPPPWQGLGPGPYELSMAQADSGHELTVITKYTSGCKVLDEKLPFKVYRIKVRRDLLFSFFAALKFISLLLHEKYDVVHNHGASAIVLLVFKKIFFLKVPIVTSVHIVRRAQHRAIQKKDIFKIPREILNGDNVKRLPSLKQNRRELFMEKLYFMLSDSLAVVSEELKNEIEAEYDMSDKISIVLNGVNLSRFGNNHYDRKQLRLDRSVSYRYLILFVGVLNGRKGEFDLLKAMEKIICVYPDVRLFIIGDGPTKDAVKAMVKNLGLDKNIKLIRNIKYSEMAGYYMAADLLVMPSYSEGLSKAVLEAIACGVPVIASDIPAHKNIIKDNETGYLFKTADTDELASTIVKALKNDDHREVISSAAKTLIKNQYTWEAVCKRLENVYAAVLI